ncbi:hypothetical protein MMC16_006362 [Acarospora aff. strigata]|nr:hypothetical protein [Acarospora aff. strigata]
MSPQALQRAMGDAYQQLHEVVERYGPLNREKGVNVFRGVDMIDHQHSELPLNNLGVMVVATAKIKQWEAVVEQGYRNAIGVSPVSSLGNLGAKTARTDREEGSQGTEQTGGDPAGVIDVAKLRTKVQRPAKHQRPAGHSNSSVIVNKRYLYRLELENEIYRQHLSRFEAGVANKLAALVKNTLLGARIDAAEADPDNSNAREVVPTTMSYSKHIEEKLTASGKEEKEALVILQKSFDEARRKEGVEGD